MLQKVVVLESLSTKGKSMTYLPWVVGAGCLFGVVMARLLTNHFTRLNLVAIVENGKGGRNRYYE